MLLSGQYTSSLNVPVLKNQQTNSVLLYSKTSYNLSCPLQVIFLLTLDFFVSVTMISYVIVGNNGEGVVKAKEHIVKFTSR